MSKAKEEFFELLDKNCSCRSGIIGLCEWLETTDFFESPASTKHHGNYSGGLVDHCLNVYDSLKLINDEYKDADAKYSAETITLVALLHDLCKVNTYVEDAEPATSAQINYLKDLCGGKLMPPTENQTKAYVSALINFYKTGEGTYPEFSQAWKVKEQLPMGHGEKSIYLIQKFIQLTDEEALAIRWHLGSFDAGVHFNYPSGFANNQAVREFPLVSMLVAADYLATWMVDVKK